MALDRLGLWAVLLFFGAPSFALGDQKRELLFCHSFGLSDLEQIRVLEPLDQTGPLEVEEISPHGLVTHWKIHPEDFYDRGVLDLTPVEGVGRILSRGPKLIWILEFLSDRPSSPITPQCIDRSLP